MPERVIVGFDGSELSREAFAYGVMLAEAVGARLLVVHAVEPAPPPVVCDPAMGFDVGPAVAAIDSMAEEERSWAQGELASLASYCASRRVACETRVEFGRLTPLLTEMASATDLIAVGQKGRFRRAGIGSTTRSLVERSPCPVMVVSGPMRPLVRVLAVYDGSSPSKKAVPWAGAVAERAGWPLSVLAAAGDHHTLDEALARAAEAAPGAQVISLSAEEQRDEARLIAHAVEKAGYALVVMGAFAHSRLHDLIFGSTTDRVLGAVKAPIVLVH